MARLNWTDQAILDLVNIVDFIAKDSVRYAKITVTRIRVASNQLKKHPLIGRAVPETATKISNQNTFTFSPLNNIKLVFRQQNLSIRISVFYIQFHPDLSFPRFVGNFHLTSFQAADLKRNANKEYTFDPDSFF